MTAIDHQAPFAESTWHALAADRVLEQLASSVEGLSASEAQARLERTGENRIPVMPPEPALRIFVAQLRSVVVLLLALAAVAAAVMGDRIESLAILAVLAINTALGFFTELRARRAMESLRLLEVPRATVVRGGIAHDVDAAGLVPGDIVLLEAGQSVPADARILSARELRTTEGSLTGESVPVEKGEYAVAEDAPLAERAGMLYTGTAVVQGTARAVVVATGRGTEVGRIGAMAGAIAPGRTPLEEQLDALGHQLVHLTLAIAAVVIALGLARGAPAWRVVETGIALAIAAIPEGLPAVATIALATGVWRMARRRALVRRLPAVETLGSATVVCTDKTGTLTAGTMQVQTIAAEDDAGRREALRIGALCSRAPLPDVAESATADPTETALVRAAEEAGLGVAALRTSFPMRGEVPFSSERQMMGTVHVDAAGAGELLVKGAPGRVLDRCERLWRPEGDRRLTDEERAELLARNEELASAGLRVLAVARRRVPPAAGDRLTEIPAGLSWVGLIAMRDPPAEGVLESIASLRAAGMRVVMLTGDQAQTAAAVARELGLVDEDEAGVLAGGALAAMDDDALAERLTTVQVLARVSPADKLRVVEALQRRGDTVAMLGDGVNDAAALKRADIGVAMGIRGTAVAREAADVVLQDDRFPTIVAAVEEGRVIYDNIRRVVFYLFSCNLAEVLLLLGAGLAGLPIPLTPLQILWLNLVTDTFPALALAVEPRERDVMQRPPRDPSRGLLSRPFVRSVLFYGLMLTAASFAAYLVTLRSAGPAAATTAAFLTLGLAQALHLGTARSARAVMRPSAALRNRWALIALATVVAAMLGTVWLPPAARLLSLGLPTAGQWMLIAVCALTPALVGQLLRARHR